MKLKSQEEWKTTKYFVLLGQSHTDTPLLEESLEAVITKWIHETLRQSASYLCVPAGIMLIAVAIHKASCT